MKILDILRNVGGAIISTVVPGSKVIIDLVNEYLPSGSKLPEDSTGVDIQDAIATLPESARKAILEKTLDIDLENVKQRGDTMRTMLETEAVSPQTTRPKIALGSFYVLSFVTIVIVSAWASAVLRGDGDMVAKITAGSAWVASLLVPFVGLLYAYFGILRKEMEAKLNAAQGSTSIAGGIVGTLAKVFTKK